MVEVSVIRHHLQRLSSFNKQSVTKACFKNHGISFKNMDLPNSLQMVSFSITRY
jgi:hypothetical protein